MAYDFYFQDVNTGDCNKSNCKAICLGRLKGTMRNIFQKLRAEETKFTILATLSTPYEEVLQEPSSKTDLHLKFFDIESDFLKVKNFITFMNIVYVPYIKGLTDIKELSFDCEIVNFIGKTSAFRIIIDIFPYNSRYYYLYLHITSIFRIFFHNFNTLDHKIFETQSLISFFNFVINFSNSFISPNILSGNCITVDTTSFHQLFNKYFSKYPDRCFDFYDCFIRNLLYMGIHDQVDLWAKEVCTNFVYSFILHLTPERLEEAKISTKQVDKIFVNKKITDDYTRSYKNWTSYLLKKFKIAS